MKRVRNLLGFLGLILLPVIVAWVADRKLPRSGELSVLPESLRDDREGPVEYRLRMEEALHGTEWVDQQGGFVRVPIQSAIEILLLRGLPTRPPSEGVVEDR